VGGVRWNSRGASAARHLPPYQNGRGLLAETLVNELSLRRTIHQRSANVAVALATQW
jgi:hypothetical protein